MAYRFYYDETEHSRKLSEATLKDNNYYDNFITVIVGWDENKEKKLERKYIAFEDKYAERKHNGELKSNAIKYKQFKHGFASMSKENLDLFSDDVYIYFSVQSKIEFILMQLLSTYRNSLFIDVDAMRYSLVKAIHTYKPHDVIDAMYNRPHELVDEIRKFLIERINKNKSNFALKKRENEAFEEALMILEELEPVSTFEWDYHMPFDGFDRFLTENGIENYFLAIDKEGSEHKTLKAALDIGHINSEEKDSRDSFGIRMTDFLAGIIAKFMKSLSAALISDYIELKKVVLNKEWFVLDDYKRKIYHKLYRVLLEINDSWYKSYTSTYSDDLISFISFLEYVENVPPEEMQLDIEMQGEYFNGFACRALEQYYCRMHNKLTFEPVKLINNEFFINKCGAKVYIDARKQPGLEIENGMRECEVFNVGFDNSRRPTVTVREDGEYRCYRIPEELSDWAFTMVTLKNQGLEMLPAKVRFSLYEGKWYANIL